MEVQQISNITKEELFNCLTENGFIKDSAEEKFTKHETVSTGKMIVNGNEIQKTQEIDIEIEYLYTGSIDDKDKSLIAHQLKLKVGDNELEFLISDKSDLKKFFGLNVSGNLADKEK